MLTPNFILLFVDSPAASAAFYADLLKQQPVETSPTFAMFKLPSNLMLGLWSKHAAEPKPEVTGGGTELGFAVESAGAVDGLHAEWKERGLRVIQPPTAMDFGYTFTALDPDGHRLRVFFPNDES